MDITSKFKAFVERLVDDENRELRDAVFHAYDLLYPDENVVKQIPVLELHEQEICPHCGDVIGEKSLYYDGEHWYHRPCIDSGPIVYSDNVPELDSAIAEYAGTKRAKYINPKRITDYEGDCSIPISIEYVFESANNVVYHGGDIENLKSLKSSFNILSPDEKRRLSSTGGGNIGLSASLNKSKAKKYSSVFGNDMVLAIRVDPSANIYGIDTHGDGIDMYMYDDNGDLKPELVKYDAIVELDSGAEDEMRILKSDKFTPIGIIESVTYEIPHIEGKSPVKTDVAPEDRELDNIPKFANGKNKVKFQDWLGIKSGNGVGKSTNGKWYGWSHRAVYGFGIGDTIKKGDVAYNGREYTIKTDDQAKTTAERFSDGVS